jgi:2,5-diketo-D-gluconate reductase B
VITVQTRGRRMPRLGFGTFRMAGNGCEPVVENALEFGYRHIDAAEMYQNEGVVGAAIAASGIARSALNVTTKVWHDHLAPDAIGRSLETSLGKLRLRFRRPVHGSLAVKLHEFAGCT